jgi:two-component system, OmpR family, KDP operon response regulator KdpE
MTRVLVIDDDVALLRALRVALPHGGFEVSTASTGEQGLQETALSAPDLVVLDLGLPDIDGVEVCRRIREWSDVPIIVLSAADAESRKVTALDAGADDYVTKPFVMAELEARIRAALRHRPPGNGAEGAAEIELGPLRVDLVHRQAFLADEALRLTARELDLLGYLARHAGKVSTHQMILEAVWGASYARETQYLHAYVHRLRDKLDGSGVRIETSPGIGYLLAVE